MNPQLRAAWADRISERICWAVIVSAMLYLAGHIVVAYYRGLL